MPKSRARHQHFTSPTPSIPTTFTDSLPLPSLIVFDLDYTLWPFWVDTHVSSPIKPASQHAPGQVNTKMLDRWGESFAFYPEVSSILAAAREKGIVMSLASRTHAPAVAKNMLHGLQIPNSDGDEKTPTLKAWDLFTYPQIYPGSKTAHFRELQQRLSTPKGSQLVSLPPSSNNLQGRSIPFEDMLFFDDEGRNRNVQTELGVTFWLVPDGVDRDEIDRGVWEWRRRRGIAQKDIPGRGEADGMAELEG